MTKKAFTLIELLVVFVILAILLALLFPAFPKMRWQTKRITCVNNLRQIGIALLLYADDNDDALPALLANPENTKYGGSVPGRFDAPNIYPQYIDDYMVFHDPSWHDKNAILDSSLWPNYNTYSFYWTGNSTIQYDADGSIIPASIRGGTYVIVFCGSYSGTHGHMVAGKYTSYAGKNIFWSDGSLKYIYADITETEGNTPRAIFNKPSTGGNLRTWRW